MTSASSAGPSVRYRSFRPAAASEKERLFLYYRKVLAEIKLCKLMILPKEGIENRR